MGVRGVRGWGCNGCEGCEASEGCERCVGVEEVGDSYLAASFSLKTLPDVYTIFLRAV